MFFPDFPNLLRITACALLLAVTSPLAAQAPSPAQLDEFMRVSRMQEMISPAMVGVEKEIRQTMGGLAQQLGMNPAQSQRFDQAVVQQLMPQIRHEMSWQKLAPLFQEAFVQILDVQDVERVLAFHRSPAGLAYQAAAMELLKDPAFINAINSGNAEQARLMLRPKMSNADFQALEIFNNTPGVQRVQSKAMQVLPVIIEREVQPKIEKIVENFMMEALADFMQ